MRSSPSFGRSSSKLSSYSRGFDLPEDLEPDDQTADGHGYGVGGAMLSVFLNDLRRNSQQDLVEVTLELDDDSIVVRSVAPTAATPRPESPPPAAAGKSLGRSVSSVSRSIRKKFPWLRSSASSRASSETDEVVASAAAAAISARDARRMKAKLQRTRSSAQRGLNGLRFISKSTMTAAGGKGEAAAVWRQVEAKFDTLAKNGLLSREDFGECIGKS